MVTLGDVRSALLAPLRRRGTTVLLPGESFGVGNLAYFWLQAHARRGRGVPTAVRATRRTAEWAEVFPRVLEELVVPPAEMSFFSPRELGSVHQDFGVEFTADELADFVATMLLPPGGPFTALAAAARPAADLTVNIRRGDYYSVPAFRGRYSFDVVEYVDAALALAREREPVRSVLIVSDDLDWCRVKLARVLEGLEVRFPGAGTPVPQQLALLAASRRLVLTNSTFSYWGAHLGDHVHGGADVIAPWFHSRAWNGGAATQLDPRWRVVRDLPGGWDG
ncbi:MULTISPECIES: alpha-1,2-fucosyltransferase [unclassified Rathayibacter]|uniref:alpha-1,2-fucosyltransferase n=1 Tax=unclassified Rathayibacter TaxID=2609250 RepID=UPI000CE8CC1A|nr:MULTISPECIES: alpha-1,2-fucosyltransferase [unclassified Rathayibacter]PPF29237.1 hypothetical protein C5C54_03490 [Rathayibacter sp. AY1F2]PPH43799.1 hypothetical protein C5C42_13185 [Rathayibacter sp. AY1F7]